MVDLGERLAAAAREPSVDARSTLYERVLTDMVRGGAQTHDDLIAALAHATHDRANTTGVGLVVARRAVAHFADATSAAYAERAGLVADPAAFRALLAHALAVVDGMTGLDDEVAQLRLCLARVLEDAGDARAGADTLIHLVGSAPRRAGSDAHWLRIHVKLTRLLLASGDTAGADTYLKRALVLVHGVGESEPALVDEFRALQAAVYDLQHRFYEAAAIFHEHGALAAAANCALLAPVSTQRTALLEALARDARTAALPHAHVLAAAANRRILRTADRALLEAQLAPHHLRPAAETDMFRTSQLRAVDVAIAEHNVDAASRVYSAVTMSRLAGLSGFAPADVEAQVGRMIARGALAPGTMIDQVSGTVVFGAPESAAELDAPYDADAPLYASWSARTAACTQALEHAHERLLAAGWAHTS